VSELVVRAEGLTRVFRDFWGRRWNLAFADMNQRQLLRRLHRIAGRRGSRFALFALSGILAAQVLLPSLFPAASA